MHFFDGLEFLGPGLVQVHRWRPGSPAPDTGDEVAGYAGLARKPCESRPAPPALRIPIRRGVQPGGRPAQEQHLRCPDEAGGTRSSPCYRRSPAPAGVRPPGQCGRSATPAKAPDQQARSDSFPAVLMPGSRPNAVRPGGSRGDRVAVRAGLERTVGGGGIDVAPAVASGGETYRGRCYRVGDRQGDAGRRVAAGAPIASGGEPRAGAGAAAGALLGGWALLVGARRRVRVKACSQSRGVPAAGHPGIASVVLVGQARLARCFPGQGISRSLPVLRRLSSS